MRGKRIACPRQAVYLLMLVLATGCATQPRLAPAPTPTPTTQLPSEPPASTIRQQIINLAERLLGVPYVWGGTSTKGMDCSGLVHYIYREVGIPVPRTAKTLYHGGQPLAQVKPGDLLFFKTNPPQISHVGIYIGNGQMIHVSSGSRRVRKADINRRYWQERLVSGATYLDI